MGIALSTILRLAARSAAIDPDAAREEARRILSEPPFTGGRLPQPFRGPLRRLGRGIERLGAEIAERLPLPRAALWTLLGALVVAGAVLATGRAARRRRIGTARTVRGGPDPAEDARALERRAAEAERGGDFTDAVRLLFRAGLIRLGDSGVIVYRPSIRTAEVIARVRSAQLLNVARSFDEIVYGGRPADADDVRSAREGWTDVLSSASSPWERAA